jgi:hypothetical protein
VARVVVHVSLILMNICYDTINAPIICVVSTASPMILENPAEFVRQPQMVSHIITKNTSSYEVIVVVILLICSQFPKKSIPLLSNLLQKY